MSDLKLGVNIDHVATIRQARYGTEKNAEPDVLFFANESIRGGADSITAHLREDRRHIQDHDILLLREELDVPLNLEMANAIQQGQMPHPSLLGQPRCYRNRIWDPGCMSPRSSIHRPRSRICRAGINRGKFRDGRSVDWLVSWLPDHECG